MKLHLRHVLFLCIHLLSGCGTMQGGIRWGEDATLEPDWAKIGESARDAATSPLVFIPAAAALLLQIGNADTRLSNWAMEHTPIAGSNDRAEDLSKTLGRVSDAAFYLSVLMTPSGDEPLPWAVSKTKGAIVQGSAVYLNREVVALLKNAAGRERPDESDDKGFPSSMASGSAVSTALASRNINTMNIPSEAKTPMNLALHALTLVVGWERIEARAHYPSDVLAGIALGYFMGYFINDAFMGLDLALNGMPIANYRGKELFVGYSWRF